MAYSTIDKPTDYFNTVLYTGNGNTNLAITGVGFQPDWVWIKARTTSDYNHMLLDSVRGATKYVKSDANSAENTIAETLKSFDSDGFTLGNSAYTVNDNAVPFASWNWLSGGTAPAITYSVKVVSDSGNKYRFDDFGTSAVTLDLQEGGTYTFDQSDSSNSGHPLRFYTASDKSGGEYTTGVTTSGTAGSSGAKTVITVAASAPTLYYQCSNHAGMGGQANTNSTFGSSNFSGSIQSTVSAGSTQGMSIVSYTGNGTSNDSATIGHGLGVTLDAIIIKGRSHTANWIYGTSALGYNSRLQLNNNVAKADGTYAFGVSGVTPSSTTFTVSASSGDDHTNASSNTYVAYCFAEKKGYSKFGKYIGNGDANGAFIYTGFAPAFVLIKRDGSGENWTIRDNKRDGFNVTNKTLQPNSSNAEQSSSDYDMDLLSNGFKLRAASGHSNSSGQTNIFMAFAESPFVNSNGIPTNAR
tara:strand:- start:491 stop:1897 length:1407 start_codon:yes stop_codon:yes gene_type:complete